MALLFAIAAFGLASVTFAQHWSQVQKREREAEWLRVGSLYAAAIESYVESAPSPERRYPRSLKDLLQDGRFVGTRRYMRQLYPDPMASGRAWDVVVAGDGGVMGVKSTVGQKTFRQGDFGRWGRAQAAEPTYADVQFVYSGR